MQETGSQKVYVKVSAVFDESGRMLPRSLKWEDGKEYPIDRVLDIRQAAAQKSGGQGDRYTVSIAGKQSYLFFERDASITGNVLGRWFVERKQPAAVPIGYARLGDRQEATIFSDGTLRRNGEVIGKTDVQLIGRAEKEDKKHDGRE